MALISPKAEVLNRTGLADDVQVGPFSYIGPDVTVGGGTVIANNVTAVSRSHNGTGGYDERRLGAAHFSPRSSSGLTRWSIPKLRARSLARARVCSTSSLPS